MLGHACSIGSDLSSPLYSSSVLVTALHTWFTVLLARIVWLNIACSPCEALLLSFWCEAWLPTEVGFLAGV